MLKGSEHKLTASWEYRGHWSNGWAFLVSSLVMAFSFSCLGCPSGTLHAETVGFQSKAVSLVLPHVIGYNSKEGGGERRAEGWLCYWASSWSVEGWRWKVFVGAHFLGMTLVLSFPAAVVEGLIYSGHLAQTET